MEYKHTDIIGFRDSEVSKLNLELRRLWEAVKTIDTTVTTGDTGDTITNVTNNYNATNLTWDDVWIDGTHSHGSNAEGAKLAQANTHESADTNVGLTSLHHTIGIGNYKVPGWIVTPPAAKDATGSQGQIAVDTGYFYICVATNTWERFAQSPWPVIGGQSGQLMGVLGLTYSS
jgi:hypothetical protein